MFDIQDKILYTLEIKLLCKMFCLYTYYIKYMFPAPDVFYRQLALSSLFEYLCYESTAIINILLYQCADWL